MGGGVAEVPFVDVVTTMLDPSIPLTVNEWDEWGDPRRPADYAWMLAYSPYDNLPPAGGRPDLLVTGAVHDARVMVFEPAKWVAALRHSDPDWAARCLFRVEVGAGAHVGPVWPVRASALRGRDLRLGVGPLRTPRHRREMTHSGGSSATKPQRGVVRPSGSTAAVARSGGRTSFTRRSAGGLTQPH